MFWYNVYIQIFPSQVGFDQKLLIIQVYDNILQFDAHSVPLGVIRVNYENQLQIIHGVITDK